MISAISKQSIDKSEILLAIYYCFVLKLLLCLLIKIYSDNRLKRVFSVSVGVENRTGHSIALKKGVLE